MIHYNLGMVLASEGRFDEAILHYQNVLRIQPEHVDTHTNLGNAFAAQGRHDHAIDLALQDGSLGLAEHVRAKLERYRSQRRDRAAVRAQALDRR